MNYTTNFNLNKPEGTDLYNHLTIDNPNMDIIDGAMQANKLASVGNATELVSGTVHAITRSDSNQNIFKFKATGDFKSGDTITVDGVSVNAYTTDGQQLLNDAYVLSAEVLCILDNTSLWVLVNKTPDSSEIFYDVNNSIKDMIDRIGDTVTESNDNVMAISGGSFGIAEQVTLNKGLWIIKGSCKFVATTDRRIGLAIVDEDTASFSADTYNAVLIGATTGYNDRLEVTAIINITATTRVYKLLTYGDDSYNIANRIISATRII